MNHNWFINQDIVCIKTHSTGIVKEGEVFTIKALQKCCTISMQVGVINPKTSTYCTYCNFNFYPHPEVWFSETLFAPLDTLTDISEIEEILKQPLYA